MPNDQPTVHFRRQPNGSWAFDVPTTGQTYYAYRQGGTTTNHPWYVTRLDATNIPEALIAKGLATRTECVERAFEDAAGLLEERHR